MKLVRFLRWMLVIALFAASTAFAGPLTEEQKIDALIHSVEVIPGGQFVRNGSTYDGKAAADHLRSKLRYAGSRVRTAEEFIQAIASKSSMSGQPYLVRFANGRTEVSEVYFHDELKRLESQSAAPAPQAKSAP